MKLDVLFELQDPILPMDYRKCFVSFFKKALQEYNVDLYETLYAEDNPVMKAYTFSVFLSKPKFQNGEVFLSNTRIHLYISCYDLQMGLHLSNAFQAQQDVIFRLPLSNAMKLVNVYGKILPKYHYEEVLVQAESPIIARMHVKGEKDRYYTYKEEGFSEAIRNAIDSFLKNSNLNMSLEGFSIVPVKGKEVIVRLYNGTTIGSLGIYQLKGDPNVLDLVLKAGIGSLRSSGFGALKIIEGR